VIVGEVVDARVNGAEREAPPVVYMSINQNRAPVNSIRVRAVVIRASYRIVCVRRCMKLIPLCLSAKSCLWLRS
jgi:hypothetical protein